MKSKKTLIKTSHIFNKCISCQIMLGRNSKQWTKYCNKCVKIRRKENAHTSKQIRNFKRQAAFKSVERILQKGRRLTASEISKLTGYKNETVIVMIHHSDLKIKRGYVYYV